MITKVPETNLGDNENLNKEDLHKQHFLETIESLKCIKQNL
jgi:hypothetical protein